MTSYVANFQKKIRIRGEKEEALRRFIAQGKNEAKLLKAAETVPDTHIRELQAKKAQIRRRTRPSGSFGFQTLTAKSRCCEQPRRRLFSQSFESNNGRRAVRSTHGNPHASRTTRRPGGHSHLSIAGPLVRIKAHLVDA